MTLIACGVVSLTAVIAVWHFRYVYTAIAFRGTARRVRHTQGVERRGRRRKRIRSGETTLFATEEGAIFRARPFSAGRGWFVPDRITGFVHADQTYPHGGK